MSTVPANHTGLAISVRNPYAELILLGKKKREFRSRRTGVTGFVWLYAPLKLAEDGGSSPSWEQCAKHSPRWEQLGALCGCLVGAVEITGCLWDADGPGGGCWAYTLANPLTLQTPMTPQGRAQPLFWRPALSAPMTRALYRSMRPQ